MLTAGSHVLTESCEREKGVKKSFVEVQCDCRSFEGWRLVVNVVHFKAGPEVQVENVFVWFRNFLNGSMWLVSG